LLTELNSYVIRAQAVLATYRSNDGGKSEKETIAELLNILDSRELHELQMQVARKSAFFTTLGG